MDPVGTTHPPGSSDNRRMDVLPPSLPGGGSKLPKAASSVKKRVYYLLTLYVVESLPMGGSSSFYSVKKRVYLLTLNCRGKLTHGRV